VRVLNLQSPLDLGAGGQHSVAIDGGGATWGWGSNAEYQLGNNSNESSSRPVQVLQSNPDQALASVVTVAARGDYSLVMLIDGAVREWGVHFDDVACIVADPKVTIKPGSKPTFFIPELGKTKPRWNQIVYRVYDIAGQTQNGRFWTPVDPEIYTADTYRVIAGLPDRKTNGDGLIAGLLLRTDAVQAVRPALEVKPSDDASPPGPSYQRYPGGLLEYLIDNAAINVYNKGAKVLEQPYGGVPAGCQPAFPRGCVGEMVE
jgi:hypothetical protein